MSTTSPILKDDLFSSPIIIKQKPFATVTNNSMLQPAKFYQHTLAYNIVVTTLYDTLESILEGVSFVSRGYLPHLRIWGRHSDKFYKSAKTGKR